MSDNWSDAEDLSRDLLICLTALMPHDRAGGVVLALGLAATRGVVNTLYAVEQAVKLPFRVLRVFK
jgi:hypothetical protein